MVIILIIIDIDMVIYTVFKINFNLILVLNFFIFFQLPRLNQTIFLIIFFLFHSKDPTL
jgi:hypothetical protein